MIDNLPKGWRMMKLDVVAENVNNRIDDPSESNLERFVGLDHLESGELIVKNWGNTEDVSSSMKVFKKGDLLFARRNAYLKRASMVTFKGVCSGDAYVLRQKPKILVENYLPLILNTEQLWDYAISYAAGSMSKRVKWRDIKEYEFPLPPIKEQCKIAEVLWLVEDCIRKNENTIEIAEKYHKILMKHLFNFGPVGMKALNTIEFKDSKIGKIPIEWEVVNVGDIISLEYGSGLTENERDGGEYPVYGSNGIVGYHSKYFIEGPGIIIGRKGTIGVANWSDNNFFPIDTTYYVRPKNQTDLRWIYHKLSTLDLKRMNMATGTPGLNRNLVYKLKIPLPPLTIQIKSRYLIDKCNKTINCLQNYIKSLQKTKLLLINKLISGSVLLRGETNV